MLARLLGDLGVLLVPLLLVLVGSAVAGHRGGRRPAEGQPRARNGFAALAEQHRVGQAGDRAAEQRGEDEEPELEDRVGAGEDADADRAGRVHRGAGGADRGEVDHRQRQADRERGEGRVLVAGVGHRQDHPHEDGGHHHLEQERGPPGVAAALVPEAVLREVARWR